MISIDASIPTIENRMVHRHRTHVDKRSATCCVEHGDTSFDVGFHMTSKVATFHGIPIKTVVNDGVSAIEQQGDCRRVVVRTFDESMDDLHHVRTLACWPNKTNHLVSRRSSLPGKNRADETTHTCYRDSHDARSVADSTLSGE